MERGGLERAGNVGRDLSTGEERLRVTGRNDLELGDADPARTLELQASLAKIVATVEELAAAQAFSH